MLEVLGNLVLLWHSQTQSRGLLALPSLPSLTSRTFSSPTRSVCFSQKKFGDAQHALRTIQVTGAAQRRVA